MTDLLPVTQADRDAVQDFHRIMAARIMSDIASERPKLGEDEGDAGTLVQAFARHRLAALTQPPETTPVSGDEVERVAYLSDRFKWAAPGDQQEDAWIVRFCDQDRREAFYRGPDAEAEARAAWEQYAPGYNMYLFRLAALHPTDPAAIRNATLEEAARVAEGANDGLTTTHTKIAAAIRGLVKEVG